MKREARLLLGKACGSLLLSVEFFNRPHDRGRVSSSLILLDHAFEMLLKAGILHRGGRIRETRAKETIGFDTCVRRALTNGTIKFLREEQALLLQTINGLRDAAQHHLLEISEGQLYLHAQAGVTLFRDLMRAVLSKDIREHLPSRVLPVSTLPPTNLAMLFDSELKEIEKLLKPGQRRRVEAEARLRPLAIFDATIRGEKAQPSTADLRRIERELRNGKTWQQVFPGAAVIEIVSEGSGPTLSLRLSKKEGVPVQLVPEGTPGASVVAVKRVDELSYYSLGAKQLAEKVGVSMPKALAIINHLSLQKDIKYYKEVHIGRSIFKRYSPQAIDAIRDCLKNTTAEAIWQARARNSSR